MRTNELRKIIKTQLSTVMSNVYYRIADDNAMYPHCVFDLANVDAVIDGFKRKDYSLYIDVFTKNMAMANDYADTIENLFDNANIPGAILPTFFFEGAKEIPDEDKSIIHVQIEFTIQNYER